MGAASAAVAADAAPPPVPVIRYDSCHTMLIDSAIPGNVPLWDVHNLPQLGQRITRGVIPEAVASTLGEDLATVTTRVRVGVRSDIQSISICAVGKTPGGSEELADTYAEVTVATLEADAQEYHDAELAGAAAAVEQAEGCVDRNSAACELELSRARSDLIRSEQGGVPIVPLEVLAPASAVEIAEWDFNEKVRSAAAGANVSVGLDNTLGTATPSSAASAPGRSIPDGPIPRALGGLLFGAGLGFAFVQFTERLDSRLRRKADVESALDLPVLAEIPPLGRRHRKSTRLISVEEPRSRSAESFRALRSALDYAQLVETERGTARPGAHVILVTSGGPSEGKTTSLANLAAVFAEGDRSVLAVNCDFRRPRLHHYLGGGTEAQRLNVTDIPGVHLVTQVTPSDADATPSDVVAAQRRLVERARERFDVILLDTAPILTTNDAAELLSVADHVVLVVSAGQTKAEAAALASELLERRGRPPLGVALIGTRDVPNSSEYYYSDDDPYLVQSGRGSKRRWIKSDDIAIEPDLSAADDLPLQAGR